MSTRRSLHGRSTHLDTRHHVHHCQVITAAAGKAPVRMWPYSGSRIRRVGDGVGGAIAGRRPAYAGHHVHRRHIDASRRHAAAEFIVPSHMGSGSESMVCQRSCGLQYTTAALLLSCCCYCALLLSCRCCCTRGGSVEPGRPEGRTARGLGLV